MLATLSRMHHLRAMTITFARPTAFENQWSYEDYATEIRAAYCRAAIFYLRRLPWIRAFLVHSADRFWPECYIVTQGTVGIRSRTVPTRYEPQLDILQNGQSFEDWLALKKHPLPEPVLLEEGLVLVRKASWSCFRA